MMAGVIAALHPVDRMTSRERMLAAYRGEEVDRLPYWVKVTNDTWRTSQPDAVRTMSDVELLDAIGADGIFHADRCVEVVRPHVRTDRRREDPTETRITHTPDGDLTERWSLDPYTNSWHPVEFPVKDAGDLKRLRWLYEDLRVKAVAGRIEKARARCRQIGDRGVTHTAWGTSPLMHLVEHVIGPVNVHLMIHEHPDAVEEVIELMQRHCVRLAESVAAASPADVVVSLENTSTTLISPDQFERYCYPYLCEYGRVIEAAGKIHELHMCGHTRALLRRIDTIPASSIEAFTAPTLGNTRLVDGRTDAPSKTLIGGTNVNTWLMPIEQITSYVQAELDACPDHRRIVLTTAGVAPPGCPLETFRQIGRWLATQPVRT